MLRSRPKGTKNALDLTLPIAEAERDRPPRPKRSISKVFARLFLEYNRKWGGRLLMVKPGMPYLDVLAGLRERTLLPLVSYQVRGEYAMIKFAARAGAIAEKLVVRESLVAFKRAGADRILTYFARDIANEGF